MTAEEVVSAIAAGVSDALKAKRLLLGIEESTYRNADIHPEYVTTVKVAERLADWDREVVLEPLMRSIKHNATGLARMRAASNSAAWKSIDQRALPYSFGKERLDILVRDPDSQRPPILFAEAKLGVKNVGGVCDDVDRVMNLLAMHHALGLFEGKHPYGAVLFHVMKENAAPADLAKIAEPLIAAVDGLLNSWKIKYPWLEFQSGLLSRAQVTEPVAGYEERYPDGTSELVFAKASFSFSPGLILFGQDKIIPTIAF